jgi:tellurite resistance-related uncharacterized protein
MIIPDDLVAYSQSPVFTQDTIPSALLKAHETKRGVWALVHVLDGRLRYRVHAPRSETTLTPDMVGVIEPDAVHSVEPIGPVRFYLEFFRPRSRKRPPGATTH